ncbi:chorismate transformation enzyme, FkbO/Hyg5 family [Leeia oryzae]|uniref:chorismate transformation enzyme, FkbO/Hyg5 family n=1 Tax=Leeia oryzae TaxID=356662 RepID=UPI00036D1462|nr:Rid family hydrolase [Leeia oryzae]
MQLQYEANPDGHDAESGTVLGGCFIGTGKAPARTWPVQHVCAPVLGQTATQPEERWLTRACCQSGQSGSIQYRQQDDLLFGSLSLAEADFSRQAVPPLQAAAESAYRQIFALLEETGHRYLWRVWNYVPHINAEEAGMERYRQFNIGRHDAFAACARPVDASPAACALGTPAGELSIAFIAARQPALCIENPRQVSAFAYPPEYGPRSPTFTRAALATLPGQHILFVSGTASIVQHQTVHAGDVAAQTRETLTNIQTLLAEANRQTGQALFALPGLQYRVYVRHRQDYDTVRDIVDTITGKAPALYVQADVCRQDLLVEIEAHAIT